MIRRGSFVLLGFLLLTGCDSLPDWLSGTAPAIKRTPGERIDVVFNQSKLTPDSAAASIPIEIPEQTNLPGWHSLNEAMLTAHIGLTGITHAQTARIGEGNVFSRSVAASPVIEGGLVIAMDAAGVISAHEEQDIETIRWTNSDGLTTGASDMLGGGLTIQAGTVYATSGNGGIRALNLADGKLKWSITIGAPIHGAPAVGSGIVAVITADNQTIAVDALTGRARWTQSGIREAASYFATTAPVITGDIVVSAYSSGEVFALRPDTGSVIWSDTLGSTIKTRASAVFSGIDADPVVQEDVVVVVSAAGEMQASALKNGRPLWQKRIGSHSTPWSAGNALYVLSDTHDLAAVLKQDGQIRWSSSLGIADKRDASKDITPALYGPILAGNALLVLDNKGILTTFKPQDGKIIGSYELDKGAVTAPIIAGGAMYYITSDAKLHRYH